MFGYFSTKGFKKYLKRAKKILDENWTGSYTKPSPTLYPYQWNGDSGFIAIGYSHYNQKRAQQELLSLFNVLDEGIYPNVVVVGIQPNESITLRFQTKLPGAKVCLAPVTMDFH